MWQVAGGDGAALGKVYDRHGPLLLAVGQRILGSRNEAEDVLHDVLLEVWRKAADYNRARGTVRSWLAMRMRCRCLDRQRSAASSKSSVLGSTGARRRQSATKDDPSRAPDLKLAREMLRSLSDKHRTVLELSFFEGLTSSEIAARIGAPIGTVKSRTAAGLAKLRDAMQTSAVWGGQP